MEIDNLIRRLAGTMTLLGTALNLHKAREAVLAVESGVRADEAALSVARAPPAPNPSASLANDDPTSEG